VQIIGNLLAFEHDLIQPFSGLMMGVGKKAPQPYTGHNFSSCTMMGSIANLFAHATFPFHRFCE